MADQLSLSRTTVENAYLQLAAEGYIEPKPGSGYYVTALPISELALTARPMRKEKEKVIEVEYDLSSTAVDADAFDFSLWQRYIKSAMRQTDRLLSYGEPQGEKDLRTALARYVGERRGVICEPDQIVIGAGVQVLLQLFCALAPERDTVAMTAPIFAQGKAVFEDFGKQCMDISPLSENLGELRKTKAKVLYTSPSHTARTGFGMPVGTRLSLLALAAEKDMLIIEDDYDSDFRYYGRPMPSLQSLGGSKQVMYIGTFSKLLLPSLRLAFLVLPDELREAYQERGHLYNQTASKVEQIALCQYIRDGHLAAQIRKTRKLYVAKSEKMTLAIEEVFGEKAHVAEGAKGLLFPVEFETDKEAALLAEDARKKGILVRPLIHRGEHGGARLSLSCTGTPAENFLPAMQLLFEVIYGGKER